MFSSPHNASYSAVKQYDSRASLDSNNEAVDPPANARPQTKATSAGRVSFYTTFGILISLAALAVSMASLSRAYSSTVKTRLPSERIALGTCGRTWQEAQSNGCVYDVMMTAWMRPECYDKELSDAYFYGSSANWTFFRDPAGTDILPHEELFKGQYTEYWVQGNYHFSHCSYIWAKQMRQMGKRPMVLDSKARNWRHTLHCAGMLAEANTTYIEGRASSHAKLGTESVDCIIGDWTVFESIPAELQKGAGPGSEE